MATAAERQVHVSTDESSAHAQNPEAISALQDEIKRLQVDLRRTQDANREIGERNKQLAATKKIPDSVVAPNPFWEIQRTGPK
jgi:uncharacterized small protein (DUF1192 family)